MDAYTLHLLGMAVEACDARGLWVCVYPTQIGVGAYIEVYNHSSESDPHDYEGPTLADALTALLTDLGVEVPVRPSEEDVRRTMDVDPSIATLADVTDDDSIGYATLRDLYARKPLTVLALLEGA
jgi:hypothetical protein